MNKWRLATLWILGFITLMAMVNLAYAVSQAMRIGDRPYMPFFVGGFIGEVSGVDYFWLSTALAGLITGWTLVVAFPPFSLAEGRWSRLQPIFDTGGDADDDYVLEDDAAEPLHETLQAMQAAIQASTAATTEANAAITKNLLMDYQLFRSEVQASMKRQENFNQLLTLLTLSTLFDRNNPQSVIRPMPPSLAAMNQALPASWALQPIQEDDEEPAPIDLDHESGEDGVEITNEELRTLIQGPVRIKAPKSQRVFRRAKRQKRGNHFVVY